MVSTYSNAQLYELVREAALEVRPENPAKLSVREFDRIVASLGYDDAPSARAICARLKRGWTEIVELALDEERSVKKTDAPKKSEEAKWLTDRHLFFSLNTVARFKQIETMTAHDYDIYLAEYLASRKQPAHLLGSSARFATSSQILRLAAKLPSKESLNPWDRALVFAGLQPVPKAVSKALTVVGAINLYIEATGCQFYPSHEELLRLRSEFGISMREKEVGGRSWSQLVQAALDERAAAGLPVPTMKATSAENPTLVLPTSVATHVATPKGAWASKTDEELVEALIPYVLDCLNRTPPVRPTKKDYQSWSTGKPDFPSA